MTRKAYLFFHLNLAFSSIEKNDRITVIEKCYDPILDIVEELGIPIGIELSGWTLEQIQLLKPDWVIRFKKLLSHNACELIGSGYCQIIGPLVPYDVNNWNQKLGIVSYQNILDQKPKVALVNEMSFSSSLIELYKQHGYQAIAMDGQNLNLACNEKIKLDCSVGMLRNIEGVEMPFLATDTILFQKLQYYAHGDISKDEYINYLQNHRSSNNHVLNIYSNDAEVFDYRPGRFKTERATYKGGEWNRLKSLLKFLQSKFGFTFLSPSEVINTEHQARKTMLISNAAYPIPVKKQAKYNIARWGLSGRNDVKLNTFCHRIYNSFQKQNVKSPDDWKKLCELWSSDYRTHITDKKWKEVIRDIKFLYRKYNILRDYQKIPLEKETECKVSLSQVRDAGYIITNNLNENLISIKNQFMRIDFNLRRGLTIEHLGFSKHDFEQCIGKMEHGFFENINAGADFYSGGVIIESLSSRRRITDLEPVKPEFLLDENNNLIVKVTLENTQGAIIKKVKLSNSSDKITLSYFFKNFQLIGSARAGIITFLSNFSEAKNIQCKNGGENFEKFQILGTFDHSMPVSNFVSCTTGFGCTSGEYIIGDTNKSLHFKWDEKNGKVMPMMKRFEEGNKVLLRTMFSLKEMDDTSKSVTSLMPFEFSIESGLN